MYNLEQKQDNREAKLTLHVLTFHKSFSQQKEKTLFSNYSSVNFLLIFCCLHNKKTEKPNTDNNLRLFLYCKTCKVIDLNNA